MLPVRVATTHPDVRLEERADEQRPAFLVPVKLSLIGDTCACMLSRDIDFLREIKSRVKKDERTPEKGKALLFKGGTNQIDTTYRLGTSSICTGG